VDVDTVVNLERRQPRGSRLVARLGAKDVALVPPARVCLDEVGQVLRGRCVIRPVVLVYEEKPPGINPPSQAEKPGYRES
jgi:hypothetical protein